jgi:hypothetical protein
MKTVGVFFYGATCIAIGVIFGLLIADHRNNLNKAAQFAAYLEQQGGSITISNMWPIIQRAEELSAALPSDEMRQEAARP